MTPAPPPAVSAATPDAASRPVVAIVERVDAGVRVRLVGRAERAVAVRYVLTTTGSGNHASQSGGARIEPGQEATLLDLTQSFKSDWGAVLDVAVEDGERYQERLHVPAG